MAAEIKKILYYSQERSSPYYPVGQTFGQNHSMCYTFQDIFHFKIQDGSQNSEKSKFVRGPTGVNLRTQEVQTLPKIALFLMFFEINNIFHFRKNSR